MFMFRGSRDVPGDKQVFHDPLEQDTSAMWPAGLTQSGNAYGAGVEINQWENIGNWHDF